MLQKVGPHHYRGPLVTGLPPIPEDVPDDSLVLYLHPDDQLVWLVKRRDGAWGSILQRYDDVLRQYPEFDILGRFR